MQTITTIGLDIAKSVFQVHGVGVTGQVVVRRQLKRRSVLAFFEKLSPCLVGREGIACTFESEDTNSNDSEADQKNGRFIASEGTQAWLQARASQITAKQAKAHIAEFRHGDWRLLRQEADARSQDGD